MFDYHSSGVPPESRGSVWFPRMDVFWFWCYCSRFVLIWYRFISVCCAAAIVHIDGVPVGGDSSNSKGAGGQAQSRDSPGMLATIKYQVPGSSVRPRRIESNRIGSDRIEPNLRKAKRPYSHIHTKTTKTQGLLGKRPKPEDTSL